MAKKKKDNQSIALPQDKGAVSDTEHGTLITWVNEADDATLDSRNLGEKSRSYYDSVQWTDAEKAKLAAQKQAATVINRCKPKVDALMAKQPPQGKMTPIDWLKRHSKPHLPPTVMDVFKYECRRLEEPEMFQPEGVRFPWAYYGSYTLATAYETATRQLSFIEEARDNAYRVEYKRGQRGGPYGKDVI